MDIHTQITIHVYVKIYYLQLFTIIELYLILPKNVSMSYGSPYIEL